MEYQADWCLLIPGALVQALCIAKGLWVHKKDVTLTKTAKELRKYRDGFIKSFKKPIANSLISYFEDVKKTLAQIGEYAKDTESVIKYLDYLVSDYEAILELYDMEIEDGELSIKGKPVTVQQELEAPALPEIEEPVLAEAEPVVFGDAPATLDSVLQYLKDGQAAVEKIVADNELRDKLLDRYIAIAATVDQSYVASATMPISRKLAVLYREITEVVSRAKASAEALAEGESLEDVYRAALECVMESVSDMLTYIGVEIIDELGDEFDTKTSKILKIVNTSDPALDKKVAVRHTSAYALDGVMLYPAKVSVYKFVQ